MEDIIRKVKALIAKAKSTNSEGEAIACAAKAKELMGKYSIDEASVDENRIGEKSQRKRQPETWRWWIAASTARLFNCTVLLEHYVRSQRTGSYVDEKGFMFVGREGERLTAELMTEYFIGAVIRSGTAYKKKYNPANPEVNMYRRACALRLSQRIYELAEQVADKQQLALVDEHVKNDSNVTKGRKSGHVPAISGHAARDGFSAAEQIGLHMQASTDVRGNLALTETLKIGSEK